MAERLPFVVQPMTLADVDQVIQIESAVFDTPWSARAFRFEIVENEHSTMQVVRPIARPGRAGPHLLRWLKRSPPEPVLGYGGFWLLVDDAHIANIAVHPEAQGLGLGELLLLSLLEQGIAQGARRSTLEVRVSNKAAQGLYAKYLFEIRSRRKGYYADNGEDAYIMATPSFDTPAFRANLDRCRAALYARLRALPNPPAGRLDKSRQLG
ncbi:MAG: ribosomal protein S18-alanine N-acetyltransferase [Anaerolineae bacterium]|jgi:ribosomal-protein-alanine N-acetyltransferase